MRKRLAACLIFSYPNNNLRSESSCLPSATACPSTIQIIPLGMGMYIDASAPVPRSQHAATITAFMFHILHRVQQIGDTAKAEAGTENKSPNTRRPQLATTHKRQDTEQDVLCSVAGMMFNPSHCPMSAHRAIDGRRNAGQALDWCCMLVCL